MEKISRKFIRLLLEEYDLLPRQETRGQNELKRLSSAISADPFVTTEILILLKSFCSDTFSLKIL